MALGFNEGAAGPRAVYDPGAVIDPAFVPPEVDFSRFAFAPVMHPTEPWEVFDFTRGYDPDRALSSAFGVGRYDEHRPTMYGAALFGGEARREVHMGIDLGAPVETPVYAFAAGEIVHQGYNPAPGDYGHVRVTAHALGPHTLYALWGHLSARSLGLHAVGARFEAGARLGTVGDRHENGGWNPHLHLQLSWVRPETHDLPGVVTLADRAAARRLFPDPRLVLGPLY